MTRNPLRASMPAAIALLLLGLGGAATRKPVDLLITNARIITLDKRQPFAGALAIRGDRIEWVGDARRAATAFGDAAQLIDLGGATVLPGINDAHGHLLSLGESFLRLNLKEIQTPREAIQAVKEKADKTGPGEWIRGWGWDEGR